MKEQTRENLMYFTIIFLIVGASVAGIGLNLEWCKVDAQQAEFGPIDVNLTAEFNAYRVDYEGDAKLNKDRTPGGFGGLAGGLTEGITKEIEDEKMFLTGMGDFQENIGVFYDSTKTVKYESSGSRWNGTDYNEITVEISTHVDLVPWWIVGISQPCEITVKLLETTENVNIVVNKIWLELQRDWDEDEREYTRTKVIWDKSVDYQMVNINDSKKYKTDVTIDKDYGRVGLVGKANITITDTETQTTVNTLEPGVLTINIYTLSQSEGVDIVLLVLAFPIAIVSIILTVLAILLILLKKRAGAYVAISAFILMLLIIIFYYRGMVTLLNQIDIIQDYFEWSYGIVVTGVGAGFMGAGGVLAVIIRPPKAAKPAKKREAPQFIITEDEDEAEELKEAKLAKKPKRKPVKKSKKQ